LYLGHNLQTQKARRPIKGSKDADFRLVIKKETKIVSCVWGAGPGDISKKP